MTGFSFKSIFFAALFVIFFSLFSAASVYSQSAVKTNFQLLDSLAGRASDSIAVFLRTHNISQAYFSAEPHPALWLLKMRMAESGRYSFSSDSVFKNSRSELFLKDFAIRYFPYADEPDSLVRTAQITVSGIVYPEFSGAPVVIPEFSFKTNDVITRADLAFTEEAQYPFASAPAPARAASFWEETAEPLVLIAAAVITLVLLFTIRSQ